MQRPRQQQQPRTSPDAVTTARSGKARNSQKRRITAQRILNIRLTPELLNLLDQLVLYGFFPSRSEAIRQFSREYVQAASTKPQNLRRLQFSTPRQGGDTA
ncbi:hypothetical protein D6783_01480 [Candidatus Woesearchaeota archaeon]|nr:MAG: hypothetical protein D6783_01480 [Candidatus Woesearchaeota archaeon]